MKGETKVSVHGLTTIRKRQIEINMVLFLRKEANWFIILITGVWLTGFYSILAVITYGVINNPEKIDGGMILGLGALILGSLYILKVFLWHIRGREKIVLTDKELTIQKIGTILTIKRTFKVELIENFSVRKPVYDFNFWGLSGGEIEFEYLGQSKIFGQNLERLIAQNLVDDLNQHIHATKR